MEPIYIILEVIIISAIIILGLRFWNITLTPKYFYKILNDETTIYNIVKYLGIVDLNYRSKSLQEILPGIDTLEDVNSHIKGGIKKIKTQSWVLFLVIVLIISSSYLLGLLPLIINIVIFLSMRFWALTKAQTDVATAMLLTVILLINKIILTKSENAFDTNYKNYKTNYDKIINILLNYVESSEDIEIRKKFNIFFKKV